MKKPRLGVLVREYWQAAATICALLVALVLFLTFRIVSIAPTLSPAEFNVLSRSLTEVLSDPLYLHQQVLQKLSFLVTGREVLSVRFPSIVMGLGVVLSFFAIISHWFTRRIAFFASILLLSSSWFLHVARIGTVDSAYLLPIIVVAAATWIHSKRRITVAAFVCVIAGIAALYIPALVWFLIPAVIWQRNLLLQTLRKLDRWKLVIMSILALIGLLPLCIALARDPGFGLHILGVNDLRSPPPEIIKAFFYHLSDIFVYRQANPLFGVGHVPYLSIFASSMVLLGIIAAVYNRRLDRMKLIASMVLGGLLFSAVVSSFSLAFLLPFLFLWAASGIALMLQQWFTVFPRNPVARWCGIILVAAAVGLSALFGITRYFIAWPHDPDTARAFTADYQR